MRPLAQSPRINRPEPPQIKPCGKSHGAAPSSRCASKPTWRHSTQAKEAAAVRNARKPGERLVLLTEEGRKLDSVGFAALLGDWASERVALVIGGADGHAKELREEADALLSLSALTFPHELARLLLMEQLYRANTILQGGPYHRT